MSEVVDRIQQEKRGKQALEAILCRGTIKGTKTWCPFCQSAETKPSEWGGILHTENFAFECARANKGCGRKWLGLEFGVDMKYAFTKVAVARRLESDVFGIVHTDDGHEEANGRPPAAPPPKGALRLPSSGPPPKPRHVVIEDLKQTQEIVRKAQHQLDELLEQKRDHVAKLCQAWTHAPVEALQEANGGVILDGLGNIDAFLLPGYDADNEVVGFQERRAPTANPKTRTRKPADDRRQMLMNAHRLEDEAAIVVISEGFSDVLRAQHEFDRIDLVRPAVVVGMPGVNVSIDTFQERFFGRTILVIVDEDDAGRQAAQKLSETFAIYANAIYVAHLPFTPQEQAQGANDLRDWFEHGHTAEDLANHVETIDPEPVPFDDLTEVELDAMPKEEHLWLIDRWIERGSTAVISGDITGGKSLIAWLIAGCFSRGYGTVLDRAVECGPLRTALVYSDNTRNQVKDGLEKLRRDSPPSPNLRIIDANRIDPFPDLSTEHGQQWMEIYIRRRRLEVVVIDGVTTMVRKDEGKDDTAKSVHAFCRRMSLLYGVTWVLVKHNRKPGTQGEAGSVLDRVTGSLVWTAQADSLVSINFIRDKGEDSHERQVHFKKVRGAEETKPFIVRRNLETLHHEFVADHESSGGSCVTLDAVLELVRAHGYVTSNRVAKQLKVNRTTANRRLAEMAKQRLLVVQKHGKEHRYSEPIGDSD